MVDVIQILIQSLFNFIQGQDQSLKGGENFDKIFTETLKDILKNFKYAHLNFQDIIDELIEQGSLQNQDENSLRQLLSYIQNNFQSVNLEDKDSISDGQNKQDGEKSVDINGLGTLFYFNFATQNPSEGIGKEENPSLSSIEIKSDIEGKKEISYGAEKVRIEGEIFFKDNEIYQDSEIYQNLKILDSNLPSKLYPNSSFNIKENVVKENTQNIKEDIANQNKQTDNPSDILKNSEQKLNELDKNTDRKSEIDKNTDKKGGIHLESKENLSSDSAEKFKFKENIQNDKDSKDGNILNIKDGSILYSKDGNVLNSKDRNISNFQNDVDIQSKEKREEVKADNSHKTRENNLSYKLEEKLNQKIGGSHDSIKSDDNTWNISHLKSENLFIKHDDSLKSDIRAESNLKEAGKTSDQFQAQISQKIEELKKVVLEAVRVSYGAFQKRAYVEANIFGSKVIVDVSLDPVHNISVSIATQDSALRAEISKHQDDLQRFLKDNNFTLQSFNVGVDLDNKGGSENFVSYKDLPHVQSFYMEKLYEEKISRGTLFANVKGRVSFFV